MPTYREPVVVYIGINPFGGRGGLGSGVPAGNTFDPDAPSIGELTASKEIWCDIEIHA